MPIAGRARELYRGFYGGRAREGVVKLFDALSDVESSGGLVIARLPTGYGKSISSVFLAAAVKEVGAKMGVSRVIHVLPLRSIVQHLYERAVSIASSYTCFPLKPDDISYQASVYLDEGSKNALFLSTLVYTTLDSYVLNFAKVTPFRSRHASYEAARAAIYTALTVFDEVHLFTEVDEVKAYTSLVTIIRSLLRSGLPVILLTATLSDDLTKKLCDDVSPEACVTVTFDRGGPHGGTQRLGFKQYTFDDRSWAGAKIKTNFIKHNQLLSKINELVKENKRVLVVRNKVPLAIKTYYDIEQKLGLARDRLALLHGRLSHGDRRRAIRAVIAGSGKREYGSDLSVIVATQVVEAGVDIDADVVVTDPAPLAQLVQRIGRVKRQGGVGEAYIIDDDQSFLDIAVKNVYDTDLVRQSVSEVKRALGFCEEIDWRIPDSGKRKSYYYLLNRVYDSSYARKLELIRDVESALSGIDAVVTVQRDEATRIHERLCGFVRDTVMVPVLVGGELEKTVRDSEEDAVIRGVDANVILDSIVNLDLSTVCRHWFEIFDRDPYVSCLVRCSGHPTSVFAKVKVPAHQFLRELSRGRCHESALLALCRKFMNFEKFVSRRARRALEGKGLTYMGFIGLIAKKGVYEEGVGWKFDERAAEESP